MFEHAVTVSELPYYIILELCVIAVVLSAIPFKLRSGHAALRILGGVLVFAACMFIAYSGIIAYILPSANGLVFMVAGTVGLCCFLFRIVPDQALFVFSVTFYVTQFMFSVGVVVFYAASFNTVLKYVLVAVVYAVLFIIIWIQLLKNQRYVIHVDVKIDTSPNIVKLAVSLVVTLVMVNLIVYAEAYTNVYGYISLFAWLLLTLAYIGSEFNKYTYWYFSEKQKILAEQKEKEYKEFIASADVINTKCHDLKRYAAEIKESGMTGREEYLGELSKAMSIFSSISNTGSSELDTLLSAKKLKCDSGNVQLDYVIEASGLSFMSGFDVYMLFDNALENAIEASMKEDKDKRIISIRVEKNLNLMYISVENYCSAPPKFKGGLPVTSKADIHSHGFGTLSIRDIVEKYGGHAEFSSRGSYFVLDAVIPVPDAGTGPRGVPAEQA